MTFFAAGERAVGEYRCSGCGYGVSVSRALPRCPMCGGEVWEAEALRIGRGAGAAATARAEQPVA